MSAFPPLEALMPHRGRMLMLGGILEHSADSTTCWAEVSADAGLGATNGKASRWIALEYMAQTIAVHAGLSAWARGEPARLGFLIGARRVEFRGPLRVGQALVVGARYVWGQASLGLFACLLRDRRTGDVLADGQLSVALADAAGRFGRGGDS